MTPGALLRWVVGWGATTLCAPLRWVVAVVECLGLPEIFVAFAYPLDLHLSHDHPHPPHHRSSALVVLCKPRGTVPHLTTTGIVDCSACVLL